MNSENELFPAPFTPQRWGYINRKGDVICRPWFKRADVFSCGLARVQIGSKWGYIDAAFNKVIPCQYSLAYTFHEFRATVKNLEEEYAVIDVNGTLVVPFGKFSFIAQFSNGLAVIREKIGDVEKEGFINKSGEVVIEPKYDRVRNFSDGLAPVRCTGESKIGYINKSGEYVIEPRFSQALPFSERLASAQEERKWGAIDTSGRFVIPQKFQFLDSFSEGLAAIDEPEGFGVVDRHGEIVLAPQQNILGINAFKEGRASFWEDDEERILGYLDNVGNVAMPVEYLDAEDFNNGIALVTAQKGEIDLFAAYIEKDGAIVWRDDVSE